MVRSNMAINLVFIFFLLACCGYGLWRGGGPERVTAVIFLLAAVLTHLESSRSGRHWSSVEFGILTIDLAVLVALLFLALRAERYWPIWLIALHIVGTAGHIVKLADPDTIRRAYAFALAFWSYPELVLLAIGTYRHQQRLARNGADPSWSTFSGRSDQAPPPGPTA